MKAIAKALWSAPIGTILRTTLVTRISIKSCFAVRHLFRPRVCVVIPAVTPTYTCAMLESSCFADGTS